MRKILITFLLISLQACDDANPVFHAVENPLRLSEWNLLRVAEGKVEANAATVLFKPRNTLFTDYAHKLRTLWIPEGERIAVDNDRFEYPVGTVLSKTFYYPLNESGGFLRSEDTGVVASLDTEQVRLLETRLLARRQSGWEAFPYVWNQEQTEAFLRVAGTSIPAVLHGEGGARGFTYFVPNENQCSGCHTRIHPDGGLEPLGAVARQLNHSLPGSEADAEHLFATLQERGWLQSVPEIAEVPDWQDESLSLDQRASAYLDMNCGHCHNPDGAADTSALLLDGFSRTTREMGLCKPPVAAGGGAGNRRYGIVPGAPEQSILLYRMASVEPDEMMPELGRALVHDEGLALIRQWVASMAGDCN